MKKPEIKDCWCDEINDLNTWEPSDPQFVDLWFYVAIGIEGEESSDNFQVHLVSEAQLTQIQNKKYMLVIPYYESWADVILRLRESIKSCEDINWLGMSSQLEKQYLWEYHNYKL